MAIKVVLAEDSYLVREGVRRLLVTEPDIDVVAVCDDYDSLLLAIGSTEPDVVLTDIRMPPTGPTRESGRPNGSARPDRRPGSSCSASTPTPPTP